jgi:hypothetical protein
LIIYGIIEQNKMEIIRTKLAMTVTCKCGGIVACTMIYGGVEIDADFTHTVAENANYGGKIEIVNTAETPIKLSGCKCSITKK